MYAKYLILARSDGWLPEKCGLRPVYTKDGWLHKESRSKRWMDARSMMVFVFAKRLLRKLCRISLHSAVKDFVALLKSIGHMGT